MAAINFPDSPSNGDTHTVDGVTYTYNSAETKWKTTINSNAFLPLSGGTVTGNILLGGEIQHEGDTDTKIHFGTDEINFDTGGSTRSTVDSAGRLLVGTSTARTNPDYYGTAITPQIQLEGITTNGSTLSLTANSATDSAAPQLRLGKSSTASVGGNGAVANNEALGSVIFSGNDGTNFLTAAEIFSACDGAPGTKVPGRLQFYTGTSSAAPSEQMRLTSSGDLRFNSGYGSAATAYGCRAWVNFDGTGTVGVTQSGNVSSITDQGTGTYDVNFSTAMPDTSYCVTTDVGALTSGGTMPGNIATGSFRMLTMDGNFANIDRDPVFAAVFR